MAPRVKVMNLTVLWVKGQAVDLMEPSVPES